MVSVTIKSTLTCPVCGYVKTETMPADACQWAYECEHCHAVLNEIGRLLCLLLLWHDAMPTYSDAK